MTRKKNKLLTFLWSLIPGAGEMYLGFFKMGTSLMALFLLLLSSSGFLNFYVLSLLSPVVWFYSFFHTNNLNSLPDEEFYALEDSYLLHVSSIRAGTSFFRSHRRFTAGCLILFGAAVLWNNLYPLICHNLLPFLLLPPSVIDFIYALARIIPQTVVAAALIAAGVLLIRGKSKELNQDRGADESALSGKEQ